MIAEALFFYFFALVTVAGAILTVTRRNAVHSAISLIASLTGVAGLYLLQKAEFLFAVQIILYVGGIMVLFLFVIMLVNLDQAARQSQFSKQWWLALACVGAMGAEIFYVLKRGGISLRLPSIAATSAATANTQQIADTLFSEYLLPFEAVSLLLLVAIVGCVMMGKGRA